MIDCGKAAELIERGEFEQIGFWRRRKLRLHLKICNLCNDYHEDSKVLSKVIKIAGVKFCDSCISEEEKERMKAHIENHH